MVTSFKRKIVVDIFFIRSIHEVHSWSFSTWSLRFSHLIRLNGEELSHYRSHDGAFTRLPQRRIEGSHFQFESFKIKLHRSCFLFFQICFDKRTALCVRNTFLPRSSATNLTMHLGVTDFTPSAEAFELVRPYSLAWFGYSYITGALVLLGLGCFMEGTIRLTG